MVGWNLNQNSLDTYLSTTVFICFLEYAKFLDTFKSKVFFFVWKVLISSSNNSISFPDLYCLTPNTCHFLQYLKRYFQNLYQHIIVLFQGWPIWTYKKWQFHMFWCSIYLCFMNIIYGYFFPTKEGPISESKFFNHCLFNSYQNICQYYTFI